MMVKSLKLDLINVCNLRCGFCPYHGDSGQVSRGGRRIEKAAMLSHRILVEDIISIVDAGCRPGIRVSGSGEALLHPDFDKLSKALRPLGLPMKLTTNGMLAEMHANVLNECFDEIIVSLHGGREIHDALTGVPGSHKKIMRGLEALDHGRVRISFTINRANYAQAGEMAEFCLKWGYGGRFQHDFMHSSSGREIDFEALQDAVSKLESLGPDISITPKLNFEQLTRFYGSGRYVLDPFSCGHAYGAVEIRPNGDAISCRGDLFGNINEMPLAEILDSEARERFTRRITAEMGSENGLESARCDRCCYQKPPKK